MAKNTISFTDHNSFFGNVHKVSNKYFIPEKQVIDDDNIIIATNNIKVIKGNPVMIVGPNQAVYVNNIAGLNIQNGEVSAYNNYAVKLNRQKYKIYTFKNGFSEFSLNKTYTFDDLLKMAKQQEKAKNKYSTHSIYISNSSISHK